MTTRDPAAGVTLIEMMVALALFAIIGGAGFAMLDQVLRIRAQTDGRLERLAELQRAMFVLSLDAAMAGPRSLTAAADDGVAFRRGDGVAVAYRLTDDGLHRALADGDGRALADQTLITDVAMVNWRFLESGGGWVDGWPPPAAVQTLGAAPNPLAVELVLTLPGGNNGLRRVAVLPQGADE